MKPSRAYLIGGAASGALIAAALASFLPLGTLVTPTTLPVEGPFGTPPEAVTVEVAALGGPADAASPIVATGAPQVPLLAASALPFVDSQPASGAGTAGGAANATARGRSGSGSGGGTAAKRSTAPGDDGGPDATEAASDLSPGLAKNSGGLPPGLAKKAAAPSGTGPAGKPGGLPPGLARKPGGLPRGLAKKNKVPPGHAKHG